MRAKNLLHFLPVCLTALAILPVSSRAQSITNADASATLNVGSAWVGGNAPGPANIAVWNSIVQVNTSVTLGADLSWGGIQILNPGGPISILADGNTLTNGTSGIDLSQATNELTLDCPVVLNGNQTWMATNGMTLTVGGVVSGSSELTTSGGGTVLLSGANTYSGGTIINGNIVEPDNAACFGTGSVVDNGGYLLFNLFPNAGIIVNSNNINGTCIMDFADTGDSAVLDGAWGGDGTILVTNLSSGSTFTLGGNGNSGGGMANFSGSIVVGDPNSVGTVRFNNGGGNNNTGSSAMTLNLGNSSAVFFTRNKNGPVTFGALMGGPNTKIQQGASSSGTSTYTIGALNENTTFAGAIDDGESSSALIALTKVGTGTLTLSGNNTYGGTTTINAGALQIGDGVTSGTGTIGLGTGAVVNNATLLLNRPDDFTVNNNIGGTGTTIKMNSNTLTYAGADTSTGPLEINQGDYLLTGSITSPVYVADGATFDVSEISFTLSSTLSGFGAVNGPLAAASGGAISPGITGQSGTLTITNGLTESGGVNNQFQISSPGNTNDLINVIGSLTVSGVNEISPTAFNGGAIPGGTYPLISYSGIFTGSVTNFTLNAVGLSASLTNLSNQIELIVTSSTTLRGPTNLTWIGGGSNYWDVDVSSNWENGATLYSFLPGDMVLFGNGVSNTNVNVDASVAPASITVSSSDNYTLFGNGDIEGSTGILMTNNTGVLTLLTTNSYTGPTIVDGGTLAAADLGAAGSDDNLGAVNSSSASLVLSGSTLEYVGATAATDRGATLNGTGATLVVSNNVSDLTINGILTGTGGLTIPGPGVLTLTAANTYDGNTIINGSTVVPDNGGCFGNGGLIMTNGYLLFNIFPSGDIVPNTNDVTGTLTMDMASRTGLGVVFDGAWAGDGAILVTNLASGATLTFGENGNGGGNMNNFAGSIVVDDPNSIGNLRFNNGGGNNNTGSSTLLMDLGDSSVTFYSRNNGASVNFGALEGGPNTIIKQGTSSSGTNTYFIGGLNLNTTFQGQIVDGGSGSGAYLSLVKVGTGTLTLQGNVITNVTLNSDGFTYSTNIVATNLMDYVGDTTISNGTLALIVPDALTSSPLVTLAAPSAILDASDMGYVSNLTTPLPDGSTNELVTNSIFEVVSGQTLEGVGTLNGILQADSGSAFNIGLPTGAFNVTSNASLSGAITMSLNGNASSELLSPAFTVNSSATLLVTNAGAGLFNGTTFTLFNHPVSFANVTLPHTDPTGTTNYIWANSLASNGTITLTSGGLPPAVPPIAVSLSGKTLTLSWGATGYTLQMQTNLLSVGISTNWVSVPGSSSITSTNITINPSTPSAFFRLVQ